MGKIRIGKYMQTDRSMENIFGKLQSRSPMRVLLIGHCVSTLCSNCRKEDHPQSIRCRWEGKNRKGIRGFKCEIKDLRSIWVGARFFLPGIKLNGTDKNKTSQKKNIQMTKYNLN